MSRNVPPRKKYTRSQKFFYALSLLIVLSMVLGSIASILTPGF